MSYSRLAMPVTRCSIGLSVQVPSSFFTMV